MTQIPHRPALAVALLFTALGCAGCSSNGPVRNLATATGFAADTPQAADFVEASRAGQLDYKPVGVRPPDRGHAPLSAQEIEAMKAGLDQRLAHNESEAATARALANTPMAQPPVIPPQE